jgi:8-oxo-dGTP diphosphatase
MFIVNVEGAVFKDDKWLIIKRSEKEEHAGGMLSLVGGKVDLEGNSQDILERTVKREIMEEVDVDITENVSYVHNTSFVTDKGEHVINIVFLCEYAKGDAKPNCPDEVADVFWMTYDEVLSHPNMAIWPKDSIRLAEQVRKQNNRAKS